MAQTRTQLRAANLQLEQRVAAADLPTRKALNARVKACEQGMREAANKLAAAELKIEQLEKRNTEQHATITTMTSRIAELEQQVGAE